MDDKTKSERFNLLLFFLLLVLFKSWWVLGAEGPVVFGDEYLYKSASEALFIGKGYRADMTPYEDRTAALITYGHYPPLYSLVLTPAFFAGENWYEWMLVINVLVSSIVVFPVWGLARIFLSRPTSWVCVVLAAIIPFHVVFPRLLMSENLFLPLFLLAVYLLIRPMGQANSRFYYLAMGMVWGLCHLTRHIFLVMLPVLFIAWWLKPWLLGETRFSGLFSRQRFTLALFIGLGYGLLYLPWLLYGTLGLDLPLFNTMGFNVSIEKNRASLLSREMIASTVIPWTSLYLAYFVLMSVPYINYLISYPLIHKYKPERRFMFMVLTIIGLTGTITLMAIFHSSQLRGNDWTIAYINGRYVMYTLPLLPILSFRVLEQLITMPPRIRGWIVAIGSGISILLGYGAYAVLIQNTIWPLPVGFAHNIVNSTEVMAFATVTPDLIYMLPLLSGLVLAGSSIAALLPSRYTIAILMVALLAFYGFSDWYIGTRVHLLQQPPKHGRMLAKVLLQGEPPSFAHNPIPIFSDQTVLLNEFDITVWGVPWGSFTLEPTLSPGEKEAQTGLLVTLANYLTPVSAYEVNNKVYNIYALPIGDISILDFGPKEVHAGQSFNLQPNGESAMWFRTTNATPNISLTIGKTSLPTIYRDPTELAAIIPKEFYSVPGTYSLQLFEKYTGQTSNVVEFTVKPSPLLIVDFEPKEVGSNQSFMQSNRDSALWLSVKNATPETQVMVNGHHLPTIYENPEYLKAIIPETFFPIPPGTYQLQLLDPVTGDKSNIVDLVVEP